MTPTTARAIRRTSSPLLIPRDAVRAAHQVREAPDTKRTGARRRRIAALPAGDRERPALAAEVSRPGLVDAHHYADRRAAAREQLRREDCDGARVEPRLLHRAPRAACE